MILKEDGYRRLTNRADVHIGDVVIYRKKADEHPQHAGLVAEIQSDIAKGEIGIFVLSQWGHDGEYFHREDKVPALFGDVRQYYTHRNL